MKFWPLRILIILSPSPNSPLPFLKFSSLRFFCTSLASCQLCKNRLEVSLISLPSSTSRMEGDEFQYNTHVKALMVYEKDYSCESDTIISVNYYNRRFEDSFAIMSTGCLKKWQWKYQYFHPYYNAPIQNLNIHYFLPIFLAITMTRSLYFALWQRGLPIRSNLHSLNIPPMTWASSFISVSKLSLACNWYKLRKHSMSLILSRLFPAMFSTCSELWKKKPKNHDKN